MTGSSSKPTADDGLHSRRPSLPAGRPSLSVPRQTRPIRYASFLAFNSSVTHCQSTFLTISRRLTDPLHHQKLICWLEDAHIRLLPIPDRSPLRSAAFLPVLCSYLRVLTPPPPPPDSGHLLPTVGFLSDLALDLHYSDNASVYNVPVDPWHGRAVPVIPGAADDPAVASAISALCSSLGIEAKPECAADGARVAANIVQSCLAGVEDGDVDMTDTDEEIEGQLVLDDLPLGFSTGDPVVDRFARVVRVLQVRQLRELQDGVNSVVAQMQAVTADPKTDSRLGKVGR